MFLVHLDKSEVVFFQDIDWRDEIHTIGVEEIEAFNLREPHRNFICRLNTNKNLQK